MRKQKNFTRITAAFFEAIIDALVFRLSFWLVIAIFLAGKTPHPFTHEVRTFFTGTMLVVFYFNSLYSFKTWLLWDEMKAILKSSLLILLVVVLYLYSQRFDISRFTLSMGIIVFTPLCIITRFIFRRVLFATGLLSTNIIILGAGRTGSIFADKITDNPFTLGKVIGFLDDDEAKQGITVSGYKVRGKLEDFAALCAKERIDEAAVAISTASRSLIAHVLDIVEFHVRQVHYIPDTYMLTTFSSLISDVDGMPVIYASQGLLNPVNRAVKSFADYAVSLTAIVILSPLMIYSAFRVRKNFGGEILTSQERSGLNGKDFKMYKFRSSGDGKISRRLRRSYVDELPQLFNVIKGDMSIVGPKAMSSSDMMYLYGGENALKISAIKPGITGFWQISDRERDKGICGEMNLYYIRNWSLWLDFVIVIKTLFVILFSMSNRKKLPPPPAIDFGRDCKFSSDCVDDCDGKVQKICSSTL